MHFLDVALSYALMQGGEGLRIECSILRSPRLGMEPIEAHNTTFAQCQIANIREPNIMCLYNTIFVHFAFFLISLMDNGKTFMLVKCLFVDHYYFFQY